MDYTLPENQTLLKDRLHASTVLVSFNKVNGERRDMSCTLDPRIVPKSETKEATRPRTVPTHTLSVYDVNASGWRSFRWDSIIEVK